MSTLSRRRALKTLGAGAGAAVLVPWLSDEGLLAYARIQEQKASPSLLVLSRAQYATLEAFVDTIIPTDDRSPGAKDARVADYIDLLLSESDSATKLQWLGGLAEVDEEARAKFRRAFVSLTVAQRESLMTAISRNEKAPTTAVETFFVMAKAATIHGYYTSEIGIHKDLRYKGNQMLAGFVGCHTEDGKDCPHCGQKHSA